MDADYGIFDYIFNKDLALSIILVTSNNLNNHFNTQISSNKLHPYFVTGLTDGEGCFTAKLITNKNRKWGYQIQLYFIFHMAERDLNLLNDIKHFFGVGYVRQSKQNQSIYFEVTALDHLQVIIDHFLKYPLITSKQYNFQLFILLFEMLKSKEHSTKEGFMKAVAIINNLNN